MQPLTIADIKPPLPAFVQSILDVIHVVEMFVREGLRNLVFREIAKSFLLSNDFGYLKKSRIKSSEIYRQHRPL